MIRGIVLGANPRAHQRRRLQRKGMLSALDIAVPFAHPHATAALSKQACGKSLEAPVLTAHLCLLEGGLGPINLH